MNMDFSAKNLIGFIVPGISDYYYSDIAGNMEETLRLKGNNLIIGNTASSLQEEINKLKLFASITDGIIIASCARDYQEIEAFIPRDFPVIFIENRPDNCPHSTILVNDYMAVNQSILTLLSAGHEKIGCIFPDRDLTIAKRRFHAYKDAVACSPFGYDPELVCFDCKDAEGIRQNARSLVDKGCTALLAGDRRITIEAFKDVKPLKQYIELIGFCTFSSLAVVEKNTNVIHQPCEEIGRLAAQQILYRRDNPLAPAHEYQLKSTHIPRKKPTGE